MVKADLLAELVFERLTVLQKARPAEDAVAQVELMYQDPLRWQDLRGDHPGRLIDRGVVAPGTGNELGEGVDHRANSAEEGHESLFEARGQLMCCWHHDFARSVVAE